MEEERWQRRRSEATDATFQTLIKRRIRAQPTFPSACSRRVLAAARPRHPTAHFFCLLCGGEKANKRGAGGCTRCERKRFMSFHAMSSGYTCTVTASGGAKQKRKRVVGREGGDGRTEVQTVASLLSKPTPVPL